MAYTEKMSSSNPGCILIMLDQSGSMIDTYGSEGEQKKDMAATAVNRVINEIIQASAAGEGIKDRCFVGVVGYGQKDTGVDIILGDMIAKIADNPLRIDKRKKTMPDGAGGLVEKEIKFPIWVEAVADWGTPMDYAFEKVTELSIDWCDSHPDSFPPVIINITDGEPNDEKRTRIEAEKLLQVSNNDGNILLFNVHIADGLRDGVVLPSDGSTLNDPLAKFLFDISSELPDELLQEARDNFENINKGSRGMIYNAKAEDLIRMLNFGSTRAR